MDPITAVSLGSSIIKGIGGLFGARRARRARRAALSEERAKRAEVDRLLDTYKNISTTNPFLNMENTMEDLTINQRQAQFQAQQFQQSQANILDTLRSSAGGSGIGALAQSLAQQGQLASQRASASIGQQEAMNQRLSAQQARAIQLQERRGEVMSRNMQINRAGTLIGMSQSEVRAARERAAQAQRQRGQAINSAIGGFTSAFGTAANAGLFGDNNTDTSSPIIPTSSIGSFADEVDPSTAFAQSGQEYDQQQYNQVMGVANQLRD